VTEDIPYLAIIRNVFASPNAFNFGELPLGLCWTVI